MSQLLIQQYLNQLATLKKVSGTQRESVVREAFKDLLKGWAKAHDLVFIPEYGLESKTKERRYVDGALLYELRVPFGYWEAKDPDDDLDAMVAAKFKRGYGKLVGRGPQHRYEEFDDDRSDIDYRIDVSLPFLYRALMLS